MDRLNDGPNGGLLVARGDLAVEVGYAFLAGVQEDILCVASRRVLAVELDGISLRQRDSSNAGAKQSAGPNV